MANDMGKMRGENEMQAEEMSQGEGPPEGAHPLRKGAMQRLQSEEMFPVILGVLTGGVAALIIITAGLHAERQSGVVMERAMIGFLVAGLVMFFACRWLHDRGIPLYISQHEGLQHSWVSEPETEDAAEGTAPVEKKALGEDVPNLTENAFAPLASEGGFSPLESSLPHVEAPKG